MSKCATPATRSESAASASASSLIGRGPPSAGAGPSMRVWGPRASGTTSAIADAKRSVSPPSAADATTAWTFGADGAGARAGGGSGLLFHRFRRSRKGRFSDADAGSARLLASSVDRPRRAMARIYHSDLTGYSQSPWRAGMGYGGVSAGRLIRSGLGCDLFDFNERTAALGCQLLEGPPG